MDGAGMEVGKYREASKSGCMCSHALLRAGRQTMSLTSGGESWSSSDEIEEMHMTGSYILGM
jgi:hypothetical protein